MQVQTTLGALKETRDDLFRTLERAKNDIDYGVEQEDLLGFTNLINSIFNEFGSESNVKYHVMAQYLTDNGEVNLDKLDVDQCVNDLVMIYIKGINIEPDEVVVAYVTDIIRAMIAWRHPYEGNIVSSVCSEYENVDAVKLCKFSSVLADDHGPETVNALTHNMWISEVSRTKLAWRIWDMGLLYHELGIVLSDPRTQWLDDLTTIILNDREKVLLCDACRHIQTYKHFSV